MSENLELKSINELLDESFYIPSYQRGYRWTKQQVEDLLEDIWEFHQAAELGKNDGFYCLQPIVVKKSKNPNYVWDVIDGQQRLTTIYILLKFSNSILERMGKKIYKIGYETRKESEDFLLNHLDSINDTNIDFFHMSKAYEVIKQWFLKDGTKEYPLINRLILPPHIEGTSDLSKNIRVIWYEVKDDKINNLRQDIDIFTRINMGKIPLTNAELVKALLLESFKVKEKQFEIASEWDQIEYSLQNDDFWFFINKEKEEQPTRIEFIFELIAENYLTHQNNDFKNTLNKSIDAFYIFHIINHLLNNDTRETKQKEQENIHENLWRQVKNQFRILTEWYEDREFFHKIGFLIIYGKKDKKALSISDLIREYTKVAGTKKLFKEFLNEKIKEQFRGVEITELSYENDGAEIRKVLLMFNLQTIINNARSNMRFQFDRFKNEDWDIEHIRSQTDKHPTKTDEKIKWIKDIDGDNNLTEDEIKNLTKSENSDQFIEYYNQVQKNYEGIEGDFTNKDRIGNLALLDASTNRGYGNAFFPIKRKTILRNDMSGTFIPICTKNVFMKYYTDNVGNPNNWNETDSIEYENKIKQILEQYLKEEVESNEQ